MKQIVVGMVGGGYAAILHGNGYKRVNGINVRLKTIVDIDIERAKKIAELYGFEKASTRFEDILEDDEIEVVDIVTPPVLHPDMSIRAMHAGKHVICEKPLTGYFGCEGDVQPIGKTVSKAKMYDTISGEMQKIKEAIDETKKMFMYAENFVYCPNVQKAAEIICKKQSRVLFMKGEESVRGSTTRGSGEWSVIGGGSLIRIGCHPLSGILWLKQQEGKSRGENIVVKSVVADTGSVIPTLSEEQRKHLINRPVDVEDIATVSITFSDETKAIVLATDVCHGGVKNYIEIYGNDSAFVCTITPTDVLNTYFADDERLEDIHISELLAHKMGWNKAFVSDEVLRGYTDELQDFVECVAYGRQPKSDFALAYETMRVIYAAYQSASDGRRITL